MLKSIEGEFVINATVETYKEGSPSHEAATDMGGDKFINALEIATQSATNGNGQFVTATLVRNTVGHDRIKDEFGGGVLPASGAGADAPPSRRGSRKGSSRTGDFALLQTTLATFKKLMKSDTVKNGAIAPHASRCKKAIDANPALRRELYDVLKEACGDEIIGADTHTRKALLV